MSEDQQHHIDEQEYNELMKAVTDSGVPAGEKDRQRELLSAGYRNLNGDPMETKVKLLARTDWTQIKYTLAESAKLSQIIKSINEIKTKLDEAPPKKDESEEPAAPMSFSARLFDFLKSAKTELATIICFAIFFPNGGAVIKAISAIINPGAQP